MKNVGKFNGCVKLRIKGSMRVERVVARSSPTGRAAHCVRAPCGYRHLHVSLHTGTINQMFEYLPTYLYLLRCNFIDIL